MYLECLQCSVVSTAVCLHRFYSHVHRQAFGTIVLNVAVGAANRSRFARSNQPKARSIDGPVTYAVIDFESADETSVQCTEHDSSLADAEVPENVLVGQVGDELPCTRQCIWLGAALCGVACAEWVAWAIRPLSSGSDLKQTRQIVLAAHLHHAHGDAYAVHGWMRLRIN
jgi:hypothetical protein